MKEIIVWRGKIKVLFVTNQIEISVSREIIVTKKTYRENYFGRREGKIIRVKKEYCMTKNMISIRTCMGGNCPTGWP